MWKRVLKRPPAVQELSPLAVAETLLDVARSELPEASAEAVVAAVSELARDRESAEAAKIKSPMALLQCKIRDRFRHVALYPHESTMKAEGELPRAEDNRRKRLFPQLIGGKSPVTG